MTISVAAHQAWNNKTTVSSYTLTPTSKPTSGQYVIVIVNVQASGVVSLTDSLGTNFSILQSMDTTGVSTCMFGAVVNSSPSSYTLTPSFPSAQSQTYEVIYLNSNTGATITSSGSGYGNMINSVGVSTYSAGPETAGPKSSFLVYTAGVNAANVPTDNTSAAIVIDSTATSGKGGQTNVAHIVSDISINAGGTYTLSWSTLSSASSNLGWQEFYEAGADTTPPAEISNLQYTKTDTSINFTWTNPTDPDFASVSVVYSDGTIHNIGGITNGTYQATGLSSSTSYSFTFFTHDTSGNASAGTSVSVTTNAPVDTTPPANVTNLTASNTTATGTTLTWSNPSDSDFNHANVYRNNTLVGNSTNGSYTDSGLSSSTTYTYKVTSVDTLGNESTGTTLSVTTADITPPAEVTNLSGTHTETTVSLTWINPTTSDFNHANVYRNSSLLGNSAGGSYSDSGLVGGTSYTYKVTTVDNSGNESTGLTINITTDAPTSPSVTIVSVSRTKISNQPGENTSDVTFNFNVNVQAYSVNVNGVDHATGTIVANVTASGGKSVADLQSMLVSAVSSMTVGSLTSTIPAGTNITVTLDNTEMYQEGDNRVNIYGQSSSNGSWTVYNS